MRAVQEFSRFANYYEQYNIIQTKVAKRLVEMIDKDAFQSVMDIGCGSGVVYRQLELHGIKCQKFWALDFSKEMLSLHPKTPSVMKLLFDFNDSRAFSLLPDRSVDLLISASALQWSSNLDHTLKCMSLLSMHGYFAIFTSNTFLTLHKLANISSPIYSTKEITGAFSKHYNATYERVAYRLFFDDVRKMFQYIKKSGVSGGSRQLSYSDTKRLMREYPYDYLEFEVLFVKGFSKRYISK